MVSGDIAVPHRLFGLVFILSVITFPSALATNFYFSSVAGDDSRNFIQARHPDTPWKSIAKLNEIFGSLRPGDTVFFKRNEVFHGTIHLRASGTSEKPIVISAYGKGEDPVISGWTDLLNWVPDKSGIYKADAGLLRQKTNLLMIDGQPQEMGRFPNRGFIRFQKGERENSLIIKDNVSPFGFQGADLVIRKNHWIIDKHRVVSIEDDRVAFSGASRYGLINDFGFFFQDHLKALDTFGEWFHDVERKEMFVYFGDSIPSEQHIRAGAVDYLITNTPKVEYVAIEKLCFSGANKTAIHLIEAKAIQVKNCTVEYSGENALTAIAVPELTVAESNIYFAQNNGLFLRYGTPRALIKNNTVEKIHLFAGMGSNGDANGLGIHCLSDDSVIANNVISEIGYSGIVFSGNRSIVSENYINSYCLVKNDGGGIYTYEGSANNAYQGRKITRNIIVNGIGNVEGTINVSRFSKPQIEGIYLDDNASGIEVSDNTVANVRRNGINIHNARNIVVKNNTFYNAQNLLSMSHDKLGDPISDVQVLDNIFCIAAETQKIFSFSSIKDDFDRMATFRGNIYAYPENNEFVFQVARRSADGGQPFRSFNISQWAKGPVGDQDFNPVLFTGNRFSIAEENEVDARIQSNTLEVRCLNENCSLIPFRSGHTSGHDIRIDNSISNSGIQISVGAIDPDSQYLLKMKVSTSDRLIGHAVLRHERHPWTNISNTYSFALNPSTKTIEKVFAFPERAETGAVILTIENERGAFRVEDIQWLKADIALESPEILFRYNPTGEHKVIKLSGSYFDAFQNSVDGELILAPFSSTILFKNTDP